VKPGETYYLFDSRRDPLVEPVQVKHVMHTAEPEYAIVSHLTAIDTKTFRCPREWLYSSKTEERNENP
jgi:hypothetical protein